MLDKKLKEYNIDDSNFKYCNSRGNKWKTIYTNEEVFCTNSMMSTTNIKKRIIRDSILEYKCHECEIRDIWNGKKIVLQLDHINGINNDNRIENIRLLCPNCHSQTNTFSRRTPK
jgi:Zn finger protein HypA/HybF involved in hydrogenase expression